MFTLILASSEIIITVSAVVGICGILAVLFGIIYGHSTNDKKHLKEGDIPVLAPACLQIHQGYQLTIQLLKESIDSNERRSTDSMALLKESIDSNERRSADSIIQLRQDVGKQYEQLTTTIRCLEEKLFRKQGD